MRWFAVTPLEYYDIFPIMDDRLVVGIICRFSTYRGVCTSCFWSERMSHQHFDIKVRKDNKQITCDEGYSGSTCNQG